MAGLDLAQVVSTKLAYGGRRLNGSSAPAMAHRRHRTLHVVAYDFGVKLNILRMLAERGCRVTVVPAQNQRPRCSPCSPTAYFCRTARVTRSPATMPSPPRARSSTAASPPSASAWAADHGAWLGAQDLQDDAQPPWRQPPREGPGYRPREASPARTTVLRWTWTTCRPACATHVSLFDGTLQGLVRTDNRRSASRVTRGIARPARYCLSVRPLYRRHTVGQRRSKPGNPCHETLQLPGCIA